MADKIASMIQRLNNLNNVNLLVRFLLTAIYKNEKLITVRVTDRIYKGKRADGQNIKPLKKPYPIYSQGYEKYKKEKGKYQGHVDWSLTGEYLKGVRIKTDKKSIYIEGDKEVGKWLLSDVLEKLYGNKVEMLSAEEKAFLIQTILFDFIAEIRKYLKI